MRQNNEDEWKFIFIGANQDSFHEAGGMGIAHTGVLNYRADSEGTSHMYDQLSKGMTKYRCSVSSASQSSSSSSSSPSERKKKMKNMKKDLNALNFFDDETGNPDW